MTYDFTTPNDPFATSAPPNSAVEEFVTSGTFVFGIAPRTNTVVGGYVDSQGNPAGFSYNGSTFTSISNPPSAIGALAAAINDSGQTVGDYETSAGTGGSGTVDGFLFSGGTFATLVDPFAEYTIPTGINDSGEVAGDYIDSSGVVHGFLYSGGTYTTIDDPLATSGTLAWGINGSGEVVGTFISGGNGTLSGASGFLDSKGVYTTIFDSSGVSTLAFGINDAGQIVRDYVDSSGGLHGFLYSDGTYTTIEDPLGDTNSQGGTLAFGIDDSGDIVGTYSDSSGLDHGFIASLPSVAVIVSKGNSPYKVSSGHTDTGDIVVSGGSMFVLSGGVADSTTVSSGGFLTISQGGTDSGTTLAGKESVFGLDSRRAIRRDPRHPLGRHRRPGDDLQRRY
jgi:autotransporter passenger strand-loop-strand repeat protein/probable HAF family extracellular repeat protein